MSDSDDARTRRLSDALAEGTSRRGFLARTSAWLIAATVGTAALPDGVEASHPYNFCGHTYTTGNCPHPTGLPRVDTHGYPLRARDGKPVDDLGRVVDHHGNPLDDHGHALRDPDGRLLPPAPRSRICLDAVPERFHIRTHRDGSWYRCCGGKVRRLMDCCSTDRVRINGDAALVGYCAPGRYVFCVHYYQTHVPC
jgi:hypothetical protein